MDQLIDTVLAAGDEIMDVYQADFSVSRKGDASPVTEADRRGEAVIEAHLAALAPDIPMVGEESASDGKVPDISNGRFWLVDPLDGTKEFIKRGGDFTVNIGLIEDRMPTAGIVYAPAIGRLFWGIVGSGAWTCEVENNTLLNKRPIQTRVFKHSEMTIVASKSHRSAELESYLANFPTAENISIGSSLKFCLLATGEADLYPRLGPTCEWDTAAAHAVLRAAGGEVYDSSGMPLMYAKDTTTFLNPWFLCVADTDFDAPPITD